MTGSADAPRALLAKPLERGNRELGVFALLVLVVEPLLELAGQHRVVHLRREENGRVVLTLAWRHVPLDARDQTSFGTRVRGRWQSRRGIRAWRPCRSPSV